MIVTVGYRPPPYPRKISTTAGKASFTERQRSKHLIAVNLNYRMAPIVPFTIQRILIFSN